MKLYKLSILALAFAGVFTACDDKDNYEPGAASTGAYFPNTLESTVALTETGTSVSLPLMRTSKEADQTVSLEVTEESGLFTIPTSVSFANGEASTDIVIGYDGSKLVYDSIYEVNIKINEKDQTVYGTGEMTFELVLKSPVVETKTKGDYIYTVLFDGDADTDLDVTISYKEGEDWLKTYTVHDCFGGVDFAIEVNEKDVDEYGCYICHWKTFYTKVVYPDGDKRIPIYCSEYWPYADDDELEAAKSASYFDPQTGLFSLYCFYILGDESGRAFNPDYDYLQLEGYPDYSVSVSYTGMFTDPKGARSAIGSVSVGGDCDHAIVANVLGTDVEAAIQGMISGEIETITLNPGKNQEVRFPLAEGGKHTIVAITEGGGKLQNLGYATYNIADAASSEGDLDMEGWETIGYAPYCDGFVLAAFGYDPFEFVDGFYVEVQVNEDYPDWIRLLNPYSALESMNENTTRNAAIDINIANPDCCVIPKQYSGFTREGAAPWGADWYVGDLAGYAMASGATYEEAVELALKRDEPTIFDGETITVNRPFVSGEEEEDVVYYPSGKDGYPVEIYLSQMEAPQAKPALFKSKAKFGQKKLAANGVKSKSGVRTLKMQTRFGKGVVDHSNVATTLKLRKSLR